MLALMLDPKFKTMWLVTTYLSRRNVVYDEKLSLCLLTKATNLLMPNSIEEIEDLQSQVHIEDLFHTTTTNVGTFRDLVSRKLVEFCPYFIDAKIASVHYVGGTKNNFFPNNCYNCTTYSWDPNQPNLDNFFFFLFLPL
jgi:hypothetical protein